jgi:hypothetical protein
MSKTNLHVYVWDGEETFEDLDAQVELDGGSLHHSIIAEMEIPSIWGFKIFEQLGSHAAIAEESDMQFYRTLTSVLGAGRITPDMSTTHMLKGRELLCLYSALCNIQVEWINKSRVNCEKTLMRICLDVPEDVVESHMIQSTIQNQATHVLSWVGLLQGMLITALKGDAYVLFRVD